MLDIGVGPLDQQARVLATEQRPGNSAGPQVDPLARILRDFVVDDNFATPAKLSTLASGTRESSGSG